MTLIPERTIERLCAYRRILFLWRQQDKQRFHSRELAEEAGITSAQVRRDLMSLKTIGTPKNGYFTDNIIDELGLIIEGETGQRVVLIGAGNLGHAIVTYFDGRRPDLKIVAVFDNDPGKIGKAVASIPCLPVDQLSRTVKEKDVLLGIVTVPGGLAQEMASLLVEAGVKAIINFTPAKLKVPAEVFVEDVDISIAIEKSAYFARTRAQQKEADAEPGYVASAAKPGELKGARKKVLCIDDDKDVIDSYRAILKGADYDVEVAFDGDTGVKMAGASKPDLIILDVMMKSPTEGFAVAKKLRQDAALRSTPILMLTAIASELKFGFDKDKDGAKLPVDAFVDKPVAPFTLLSAIRKLLRLPKDQINTEGGGRDFSLASQIITA
ncbi:MAG: redox-sensing transcriptional repressor Rex [Betaproteobacteria bacterium]